MDYPIRQNQNEHKGEMYMKLKIEEMITNVKDELLCYEGMEQKAEDWDKEFREWIKCHMGKSKDILKEGDNLFFRIRDEEEIFEIADSYMDALEEGSVKAYWEKF